MPHVIFFRLRVVNQGKSNAEGVEIFAENLCQYENDDKLLQVSAFEPMRLLWSNIGQAHIQELPKNGSHRYCDLGYIIKPPIRSNPAHHLEFEMENNGQGRAQNQTLLSLALEKKPFSKKHLLLPGKYKLLLSISGKNLRPFKRTLDIYISGTWHENEEEMFKQGIAISIV